MAALARFLDRPTAEVHGSYASSILSPVAPEYTTGEGLVAAAYRTLLLGIYDREVDLEKIARVPADLVEALGPASSASASASLDAAFLEAWRDLVNAPGGLRSPTPSGSPARLPQLTPLVPRIAHRSGVIGKFGRGRWQPGNLLLSTIWSGAGPDDAPVVLGSLADALDVGRDDDLFARYVDNTLALIHPRRARPSSEELAAIGGFAPAWRARDGKGHTPAEQFVRDLQFVIQLKAILTRRQWTALVEAHLRLGLAMHQMWLCRLNARVWGHCLDVLSGGVIDKERVAATCWQDQEVDEPFLMLGADSTSPIRRLLSDYARARLGLNLVLYTLDDVDAGWDAKLGAVRDGETPSESIARFLDHVRSNADDLNARCGEIAGNSIPATAGAVADAYPRLINAQLGVTRNLSFFLRYTLGQLQAVDDEFASYDQSFLIRKPARPSAKERMVQPGPAMLILLVHSACQALKGVPASMDILRRDLRAYGLGASADELRTGVTIRELERLELVVDSPDAGGGRLLVDPLPTLAKVDA